MSTEYTTIRQALNTQLEWMSSLEPESMDDIGLIAAVRAQRAGKLREAIAMCDRLEAQAKEGITRDEALRLIRNQRERCRNGQCDAAMAKGAEPVDDDVDRMAIDYALRVLQYVQEKRSPDDPKTVHESWVKTAWKDGFLYAHPPQPSPASASQGLPEYHEQYLDAIGEDPLTAAAHAIGVKYLMVGELKVKDDSSLIYKGLVLPVLGYYMKWPSVGHHSDGWDEYRVSLVGKGFEHQETNIATGDIEWINAERLTKLAAKSNLMEAGKQSAPNHKTFEFDSTGLMEGAEERWSDYGYDNPKRAEERFGSSLVVWKTAWIESRAALVGQAIPQPTEARVAFTEEEIERYCIILHDAYESAAIKNGWQTQQRSRKPWPDVPDENKKTMRDAITVLMKKALANTHGMVVSVDDVMKAHTDCVEGNGVGDIQYVRYRNFRTRLTELFNTTKP